MRKLETGHDAFNPRLDKQEDPGDILTRWPRGPSKGICLKIKVVAIEEQHLRDTCGASIKCTIQIYTCLTNIYMPAHICVCFTFTVEVQ